MTGLARTGCCDTWPKPCPYHEGVADALDAGPDPVGLVEIADRLGVARQTVDAWRYRDLLPQPRWTVGGRPAWAWPDVAAWATATGRQRDAQS